MFTIPDDRFDLIFYFPAEVRDQEFMKLASTIWDKIQTGYR